MIRLAAALLAAWLACAIAATAWASTEEFSSFDPAAAEEDDETLLDHLLQRTPEHWDDEWRRQPNAMRVSQGCVTSGQWVQDNTIQFRTPLGVRPWMDVQWRQMLDNDLAYEHLQFDFRFPFRSAVWGVRFRPSYDKSRQDLGVLWDAGSDSSRVSLRAALMIEDAFNELWSFRQTRVGDDSAPYTKHPFEPYLRARYQGSRLEMEAWGQWLTPSAQRVLVASDPTRERHRTLWGAKGRALARLALPAARIEARVEPIQVRSSDRPITAPAGESVWHRRAWRAELAVRSRSLGGWSAEARGVYQDRGSETSAPQVTRFRSLDRVAWLEIAYAAPAGWYARTGLLRDRVTVRRDGLTLPFGYGTRNETRAYVGLEARFGRVRVQGIEGIELDVEPYEVSFHHDKGFLQLQTTF